MSGKKKVSTASNSNLGLLLLVLSLCMDGICGMQQDIVVPRYKPSSLRLQQMLNVYGIVVSLIASLFLRELQPGFTFLIQNRVCLGVHELESSFTCSMPFSLVFVVLLDKCSFCILYVIFLLLFFLPLLQPENSSVFCFLLSLWEMRSLPIRFGL